MDGLNILGAKHVLKIDAWVKDIIAGVAPHSS
jgi:hypothetical protein